MICTKRNCEQCASVEHTGQKKPVETVWESAGTYGTHYEDDGPGRGGYFYTD